VGEVIKEARLNGIRPMTIERLLAYLGYDMNAQVVGRAEAVDNRALQRLIAPRHPTETQAKPAAETTKAEPKTDDAKPAAEMKDDEPKDEQPKPKATTKRGRAKAAAKKKAANDDDEPK